MLRSTLTLILSLPRLPRLVYPLAPPRSAIFVKDLPLLPQVLARLRVTFCDLAQMNTRVLIPFLETDVNGSLSSDFATAAAASQYAHISAQTSPSTDATESSFSPVPPPHTSHAPSSSSAAGAGGGGGGALNDKHSPDKPDTKSTDHHSNSNNMYFHILPFPQLDVSSSQVQGQGTGGGSSFTGGNIPPVPTGASPEGGSMVESSMLGWQHILFQRP